MNVCELLGGDGVGFGRRDRVDGRGKTPCTPGPSCVCVCVRECVCVCACVCIARVYVYAYIVFGVCVSTCRSSEDMGYMHAQ